MARNRFVLLVPAIMMFSAPIRAQGAPPPGDTSGAKVAPGSAPTKKQEATKPNAAPARPEPTPVAGTSAMVLDLNAVAGVLGMSVKSYKGEDMGHVVDLLVTPKGEVRAAVVDFGGVLGVGSRKVAVDWKALSFAGDAKGEPAILALTRDQVRVAPEYKTGDPVVILEAVGPADAKSAAGTSAAAASAATKPAAPAAQTKTEPSHSEPPPGGSPSPP